MESEDFEVINISEMDANNMPAASDMFATETKSETAVKTTLAKVAEFTNGITGTCDTLAAEAVKTVILPDYDSNVIPREFDVVFVHKNTYGDVVNDDVYPTMTILNKNNQEIASNIPIADSRGHNAGALCWNDNDIMSFKFMAGKVCIMNSNVRQVTDSYTLFSDGSTAYNKPQIDNNYVHKEDGKGLFSGEYEDLNNKPAIPENVLKYVAQLLTEEQKQQAAANIGIPDTYATIEEVTAIENKIPDQASEENQLADKDFVNSSIASNTAYFIGNFDTLEELENQTETPVTLNDYAFVKGTDSEGNLVYKRYKYTGTEWLYEYDLNNSSFTAQQWAVINSGITADKVAEIDETVRFTAQDLTSEQKVQARANIGANTSSITMAGYSKPDAASAIAAGDSLNDAVGKLEKTFDSYDKSNEVDSKINDALVDYDTSTEVDGKISDAIKNMPGSTLDVLKAVYPVNSIYISTSATNPSTIFGFGTWTQVGQGRALWGSATNTAGGGTIDAGLPNITGTFGCVQTRGNNALSTINGAFREGSFVHNYSYGSGNNHYNISFDASRSNSLYGKSSTVQPNAYTVCIWRRTA